MGNAPDKKFSLGGITIAAWLGEDGVSFSPPQKRYKSKDGEWKEAKSFYAADLVLVKFLCDAAARWALMQEKKAKAERQEPEQGDINI